MIKDLLDKTIVIMHTFFTTWKFLVFIIRPPCLCQRVGFKANLTGREDITRPGNIRFFKTSLQTAFHRDCDSKSLFIFTISSPKQNPRAKVQTFNQNITLMI